jgi:hypothetical protein
VATNRQRILDKVRMVDGTYTSTNAWFGASYGYGTISNMFCGVPALYTYLTAAKASGPMGTGSAAASTTNYYTSSVYAGDVLQFYNTGWGDWRHSVYVVRF